MKKICRLKVYRTCMSTERPIVTVVTVTFNLIKNGRVEAFRQCVESVHSQDYPNIEHLVVDGASTDGTLEMIREYEEKGWLVCRSEPDEGIYDAMNKGIRMARGKYVAFLNSDDFWHDTKGVSLSVRELEATGATLSYADRNAIAPDGSVKWVDVANVGMFACDMPFCHQTVFTRRDALLRYDGFNLKEYKSAADYELIVRMILNGEPMVYVPCNFTSFRYGGFSVNGEELSRRECAKIKQALLPWCSVEQLNAGYMTADLMRNILSRVHSSVAAHVVQSYFHVKPDLYRLITGPVSYDPEGNCWGRFMLPVSPTESVVKLFGFIPLLKLKYKPSSTEVYFLGVPLAKIRKRGNRNFL